MRHTCNKATQLPFIQDARTRDRHISNFERDGGQAERSRPIKRSSPFIIGPCVWNAQRAGKLGETKLRNLNIVITHDFTLPLWTVHSSGSKWSPDVCRSCEI